MTKSAPARGTKVAARVRVSKAEKVARIQALLQRLYPEPPIPLLHDDPFTLLCAVVLSAQTTDKKVNQVTPALFAEAPTPQRLAQMDVSRIHALIREVGLAPQKARALRGLAELLVTKYGGVVPREMGALVELPGVGRKTAQVVMAQAFGIPSFPVDTHIHRLAARWGLSSGRNVEQTERDLKRLFPKDAWNALHLQIIYFGREHCPALRHDPHACPICKFAAKRPGARGAAKRPGARGAAKRPGARGAAKRHGAGGAAKRPRAGGAMPARVSRAAGKGG